MDYRDIVKGITNFFSNSFGQNTSFIVDSSNPLTSAGGEYTVLEVLEDAAGVSITDANLSGVAAYPTDMTAGLRTYGKFTAISCTGGKIKMYKSR